MTSTQNAEAIGDDVLAKLYEHVDDNSLPWLDDLVVKAGLRRRCDECDAMADLRDHCDMCSAPPPANGDEPAAALPHTGGANEHA